MPYVRPHVRLLEPPALGAPSLPPSGATQVVAPGLQVWLLRASPSKGAALVDCLSEDDRARMNGFADREQRLRYAAMRGSLRKLLSRELEMPPSEVPIVRGPHGKPQLSSTIDRPVAFNVSHSGPWAAIAISHRREVGIDIELHRPRPNLVALATRGLTPTERSWVWRAPESSGRQARFLRIWTAKEAFLKLWGMGLRVRLDTVELDDPGAQRAIATRCDPEAGDQRCVIQTLQLGSNCHGAVAVAPIGVDDAMPLSRYEGASD